MCSPALGIYLNKNTKDRNESAGWLLGTAAPAVDVQIPSGRRVRPDTSFTSDLASWEGGARAHSWVPATQMGLLSPGSGLTPPSSGHLEGEPAARDCFSISVSLFHCFIINF